jgi:cytochrome b
VGQGAGDRRVRIWDVPTRLFHWLLVVLLGLMWWSGKSERMQLHLLAGSCIVGLLVFRIIWGFVGGSTARFANFLSGPRTVMRYIKGHAARSLGHNPLGGWSVVAMLALLCVQVGLGLFASDEDGLNAGPLSHFVTFDQAVKLGRNHALIFNLILAMVALHVAAILFYALVRRRDLVRPMLHGRGDFEDGEELAAASPQRLALAIAVSVLAALVVTRWL